MKHHMTGKVIGVELYQPDPKDLSGFEVAKVKVKFTTSIDYAPNGGPGIQMSLQSTGTLVVPLEHVGHRGDFALGRVITADFEDYQQELTFGRPRVTATETAGEFFDTTTGEKLDEEGDAEVELQIPGEKPVKTTLGKMRTVADQLKSSKARTTSRHN